MISPLRATPLVLALLFAGNALAETPGALVRDLSPYLRADTMTAPTAPAAPKRTSALSAGPGGPLLILNETLIGAIGGGIIAAPGGRQQTFGGVVLGGLVLGGAGAVYQYYVPVGQNVALMSTIAAGTGILAGLGIGSYANITDASLTGLLVLGTSQLGALASYALGYGIEDFSAGDFGLTVLSGAYATLFSLLAVQAFTASGTDLDLRPLLFAPAGGLIVGGLLASAFDLAPGRLLKMTGIPMLTGLILYYSGVLVAGSGPIIPIVAGVGMGVALALTTVFTAEPPAAPRPR